MDLLTAIEQSRAKKTFKSRVVEFFEDAYSDICNIPDDISHSLFRGKQRILKLVNFIKLGWEDEDWDHGYLTKLLTYKLNAMSNELHVRGHAVDSELRSKQLRVAAKALNLWQSDRFVDIYRIDKYETTWKAVGDLTVSSHIVHADTKIPLTEDELKLRARELKESYKKQNKALRKYKLIFFKIMYRNYSKFWD